MITVYYSQPKEKKHKQYEKAMHNLKIQKPI